MEKRIFTLVLVVAIGVLSGVYIVSKQAREPILRDIAQKQNVILQAQSRLEKKLGSGSGAIAGAGAFQNVQNLEARINTMEARINSLESQLKQAQAAAPSAPPGPPPEDPNKVYDIAVAHSPVRGNKNAPVTIVEFADFECPFCARFHTPVVEVLKSYPKQVNYILKNFPLSFHPNAKPAAKAAFAAGEQGKYWEMADALLENGRSLSEEKYEELAKNLGLNVKKFLADYRNKDAQWEDLIQKDISLAGQVNVRGTPTFYINGKKTNARDVPSLKREIDQILNSK